MTGVSATSAKLLLEVAITRWRTRAGDVDVMIAMPGEGAEPVGFRELNSRAVEIYAGDTTILLAALEDIVRSKEIAATRTTRRYRSCARSSRRAAPVLTQGSSHSVVK